MTRPARASLTRRTALLIPAAGLILRAAAPRWRAEEVRRVAAPEARQGVAVDAAHLYAIDNHAIAKYDRKTGKRVAAWACEQGKPLIHLNGGIVRDGLLHCTHSNYPLVPMLSSIETWDARTLRKVKTHSFGIEAGSATWADLRGGLWYVTFAHYANRAAEPNRDPRWTALVEFDSGMRRLQGWVYPSELLAKLGQYSISGGVFHSSGVMLCTGHDNPEVYVLRFPDGGSTLTLEDTFAVPVAGQGIALDPASPSMLYGIDRAKREIVEMRLSLG